MSFHRSGRRIRSIVFTGIVCSLFGYAQGFAASGPPQGGKMLIISDIDDTLKISNVRGPWEEFLPTIVKTRNQSFLGMASLLSALSCQGALNPECARGGERLMRYVTAAQGPLAVFGKAMLFFDGFPAGEVFERSFTEDKFTYKTRTILELALALKPDVVVMLGDNGELDPAAYAEAAAKISEALPATQVFPYIHMIYPVLGDDDRLYPDPVSPAVRGQKGFVTAIDLGAALATDGLLPAAVFEQTLVEVWPIWKQANHKDFKRLFPGYFSCGDWAVAGAFEPADYSIASDAFAEFWPEYSEELMARCDASDALMSPVSAVADSFGIAAYEAALRLDMLSGPARGD